MLLKNYDDLYKTTLKELKLGGLFVWGPYTDIKDCHVFIKYSDHIVEDFEKSSPNIMPITHTSMGYHWTLVSHATVAILCDELDDEDIPLLTCLYKKVDCKYDKDILTEICKYLFDKYVLKHKHIKLPSIYTDIV